MFQVNYFTRFLHLELGSRLLVLLVLFLLHALAFQRIMKFFLIIVLLLLLVERNSSRERTLLGLGTLARSGLLRCAAIKRRAPWGGIASGAFGLFANLLEVLAVLELCQQYVQVEAAKTGMYRQAS